MIKQSPANLKKHLTSAPPECSRFIGSITGVHPPAVGVLLLIELTLVFYSTLLVFLQYFYLNFMQLQPWYPVF